MDRHEGRRRRGAVAGVLLVGTLALGGGLLARAIGELGAESGSTATRDSDPRVVVGSSGPSSARPGSASSLPPASPIQTGISPALLVNFDLTPVGPLDPGEPPIARAIGDPQISPFPTPFDRSLRLTGPAAGVCVRLPADAARPLSAMTFDLYLGEAGSGGRIIIGAAALDPAHGGLALDLATLDALDREAWYRLVVTRPGDATGVAVRSTGGGRLLLEAELEADPAIEPTSPGEACLSSSLPTAGASLFVDNLRLDR